MSFLDDIGNALSGAFDWVTGSNVGKTLLSIGGTALAGYALSQVTKSVTSSNTLPDAASSSTSDSSTGVEGGTNVGSVTVPDPGVRLQLSPSTDNKIPVIYGDAVIGGKISDVRLSDDGMTMSICFTLCEQTGKLNCGQGADSEIKFLDVYWNDQKILWNSDGITALGAADSDGNVNNNINGLIKIFLYSGDSESPVVLETSAASTPTDPAYNIMPGWDNTFMMPNLVFAIVKITYDKTAGLTNIGTFKFKLRNTMSQPGDCLYDYMTNTIYGAGMLPEEINA